MCTLLRRVSGYFLGRMDLFKALYKRPFLVHSINQNLIFGTWPSIDSTLPWTRCLLLFSKSLRSRSLSSYSLSFSLALWFDLVWSDPLFLPNRKSLTSLVFRSKIVSTLPWTRCLLLFSKSLLSRSRRAINLRYRLFKRLRSPLAQSCPIRRWCCWLLYDVSWEVCPDYQFWILGVRFAKRYF